MTDYINQHGSTLEFPANGQSWVILSDIEKRIKEKIEKIGKPLKEWDINIFRGILTGCNEAFIIDKAKRDELIAKDPKSAEIIRPILRGRYIKRYGYEFADLYLLFIPWHFPYHLDTTITGASKKAEEAFKKEYPAIYEHLTVYKKILSARNTAETGIRYEWYALQRWGANYWDDFSKQKIIWLELVDRPNFALDNSGFFLNNTVFFINGEYIHFLIAYLNSSLCDWQFGKICATSGTGTRRWIKQYIEQLCVPIPNEKQNQEMEHLIEKISKSNISTYIRAQLISQIDNKIFELFNLSEEEKSFVKTQFPSC